MKRKAPRDAAPRASKLAKTDAAASVNSASAGLTFDEPSDGSASASASASAESRSASPHTRRVNVRVPASKIEAPVPVQERKLYTIPTRIELEKLRESSELYKSSLFKMQMDRLLGETHVPYRKLRAVESALLELKRLCDSLPAIAVVLDEASGMSLNVARAGAVRVLGSFMLRTVARPNLTVDVGVELPAEALVEKDMLSYRYAAKRNAYLTALAEHIRASSPRLGSGLTFEALHGDVQRPALVLRPGPDSSSVPGKTLTTKWSIRLLPILPAGVFPQDKLLPDRNNVRKAMALGAHLAAAGCPFSAATPRYNAALLEDMHMTTDLAALHAHLAGDVGPALADAISLVKVWLRLRNPDRAPDAPTGFVGSMVLVHLLRTRRITRASSSYQMFRAFIEHSAAGALAVSADGLHGGEIVGGIPAGSAAAQVQARLALFRAAFPVVLLDETCTRNYFAFVSADAYAELVRDAAAVLGVLNDTRQDGFALIFGQSHAFALKFDVSACLRSLGRTPTGDAHAADGGGDIDLSEREIVRVLRRGLASRIALVRLVRPVAARWALGEAPPSAELQRAAPRWLRLVLVPGAAQALVDHGPSAEDSAAAEEFRAFWGAKAELRRFLDGSIREAVAWDVAAGRTRRDKIVPAIVRHLLAHHFALDDASLVFAPSTLHSVLNPPSSSSSSSSKHDAAAVMHAAVAALDGLASLLRRLDGLPLAITDIKGAHAAFRYTAVFPSPPGAPDGHAYVEPLDVVVRLEEHFLWPTEPEAARHVKAAFLVELAKLLAQHHDLLCGPTLDYLDVPFEGFVFRLRIFHRRALTRLERGGDATALASLNWEFSDVPLLSMRLHTVQAQHPSFGPAVRLTKQWLHSHQFSLAVREELVEAIAARAYLAPAPFGTPCTPVAGFLRALHLLGSFDFAAAPLVVDFDASLDAAALNEIATRFHALRSGSAPDAGYAMFVATNDARDGLSVAESHPAGFELARLQAFARSSLSTALALLSGLATGGKGRLHTALFQPSFEDFDVVLELNTSLIPRRTFIDSTLQLAPWLQPSRFRNLAAKAPVGGLVCGFSPVAEYAQALVQQFGEYAVFCCDVWGGDTMCLAWKPKAFVPRSASAAGAAGMVLAGESGLMVPNTAALLDAIVALGHELVVGVQLVRSRAKI